MQSATDGSGTNWKTPVLFFLCLIAALVWYYFPFISGQRSFFQGDISYHFEPMLRYIADSLRQGRVPLWNPWLNCGMSQIAIPNPGVFYPLNLFFLIPNFNTALAFLLVFHEAVAGLGAYLLVVRLGWGRCAAITAALCVALNGYMMTGLSNFTLMATASWVPLASFFLASISAQFSKKNMLVFLAAALSIGLLITAGRPEVFAPAIAILLAFVMINGLQEAGTDRKAAIRMSAWKAGALLCGIGLAMPMLAPTIEWWRLSYRAAGMDPSSVLLWSADWYDLAGMFLLQPVGNLAQASNPYSLLVSGRPGAVAYLPSAFITPIVLFLALRGAFDSGWKQRWWFLLIVAIGAIVAAGQYTPIMPSVIKALPGATFFRYPIKAIIFCLFALSVLAARGVFLIENRVSSRSWAICSTVLIAAAFVFSAVLYAHQGAYLATVSSVPLGQRLQLLAPVDVLLSRSLFAGATIVLGFIILALACTWKRLPTRIFAGATITIVAVLLSVNAVLYPPIGAQPHYWQAGSALADKLKPALYDAAQHTYTSRIWPDYFEPVYNPNLVAPGSSADQALFSVSRSLLVGAESSDFSVPNSFGYEGSITGRFKEVTDAAMIASTPAKYSPAFGKQALTPDDKLLAQMCSLTATRLVSTTRIAGVPPTVTQPLNSTYFEQVAEDPLSNFRIFRTKHKHDRAFFAPSVVWVDNWKPLFDRLLGPSTALIEETYIHTLPGLSQPAIGNHQPAADQSIVFQSDAPELVRLRVATDRPRMLVLADTYYPGWRSFVDSAEVPLYKANAFFRAVFVPAGTHIIEFKFQPISLLIGVLSAAASTGVAIALYCKAPG